MAMCPPHLSEHVVIQNVKALHEGLLLTFYSKLQKMAGGVLYLSAQSSQGFEALGKAMS